MMSKSMVTMGGGMDGEVARGVDSSAVLFLIVIFKVFQFELIGFTTILFDQAN